MYTDMVGYTALGQRNESLSLALLEEQRKLIRPVLSRHNGREVKTIGDAFMVEFSSALDAVRCAYDIQRATREFNFTLSEERRLHLRVGIHLGDVVESNGDISGDAVNVASRIEPLAEDGGVCLTRQVYDQVQNKFELPLASLETRPLSGVGVRIDVFKMTMPWYGEKAVLSGKLDSRRIAVLPFANISPNLEDEYFADGMTDELISVISQIREIRVIARTSALKYKGSQKGIAEIGRELKVGTVLEGTVRKSQDRVRISVQLVDAQTEEHLWARRFDRKLGDVFRIQGAIAAQVARELKLELARNTAELAPPTRDVEAHTFYLRARYHWNKRSEEGIKTAISYLEDAIDKDSEYSLALVGLADCYHISALFGYTSPRDVYPRIRELAQSALKAGGASAEAHASMGEFLMHYSYDWPGAARELERSLKINPNYAIAHIWRSSCCGVLGQLDIAQAEARRGEELDPFAVVAMNEVAKNYYFARRYDEAIKQYIHSLEIEPDSAYLHKGLAETYAQQSMFNEATRAIERALTISGRSALCLDSAACVYALSNEVRKSREVLAEADKLAVNHFVPSYGRAAAYAVLGDKAKALLLLQTAYDEHSWLIWLGVDPIFDSLRDEPSFHSLLRKMNLELDRTYDTGARASPP
jgi:TolB-like protein